MSQMSPSEQQSTDARLYWSIISTILREPREDRTLLIVLAQEFFGEDLKALQTLSQGLSDLERDPAEFERVLREKHPEHVAKAFEAARNPILPDGFENFEEWEKIVLSMLRAQAAVYAPSRTAEELERLSFIKNTICGSLVGGFARSHWIRLFKILQRDGKVQFDHALSFFRNIDSKRQNFKLGRASLTPLRQWLMAFNWAGGDPQTDEFPALCTMDNLSAALVLARLEEQAGRSKDMVSIAGRRPKKPTVMTAQNFSREKCKLGLVSCRKPLWKVIERGTGLKISRMR